METNCNFTQKTMGSSKEVNSEKLKGCYDGCVNPKKAKGRKPKLAEDNPGLIADVAVLNGPASPKMAAEICNTANPSELKACQNTLTQTIQAYTDFDLMAILREKRSKDPHRDWAKVIVTIAMQRTAQVKLGREIDSNNIIL
jgi:hypothetical protein